MEMSKASHRHRHRKFLDTAVPAAENNDIDIGDQAPPLKS